MRILNGILAFGLTLTLFGCGLFDSGSDQKDSGSESDPRRSSGKVENYNGGAQDLFAPNLEIDDSLNSLAIDPKVGTIDNNGEFEFELPVNLNLQETVTEFFAFGECSGLEVNNGNAKVTVVGHLEVGSGTSILMQASSQQAAARISASIFGSSGDSSIIRYYLDAEASIKGLCVEAGTNNEIDFDLDFKKGWNYVSSTVTKFVSLEDFAIKFETKDTTNLEWFFVQKPF